MYRDVYQKSAEGVTSRQALNSPELYLPQMFQNLLFAFNNKEIIITLPEATYDLPGVEEYLREVKIKEMKAKYFAITCNKFDLMEEIYLIFNTDYTSNEDQIEQNKSGKILLFYCVFDNLKNNRMGVEERRIQCN